MLIYFEFNSTSLTNRSKDFFFFLKKSQSEENERISVPRDSINHGSLVTILERTILWVACR